MNAITMAVMALAALGVVASPSRATTIDRDFHQSFEVSEGFRLEVNNGDGDVTITPWDQDVIDVAVRCRADVVRLGVGDPPDFTVDFETGDDFVKVTGRMLPSGPAMFQSVQIYDYRYTIRAPAWVMLEINGSDGDIEISGWRAEIDCALDDGDVLLDNVAAPTTRIALNDGDVTGVGVSGELRISGDDGEISLSKCGPVVTKLEIQDGSVDVSDSRGSFDVSVDDGNVSLALVEAGDVRVRAADGDVSATVAEGSPASLDIETDDGEVFVSMPPASSYSFRIQTDGGRVSIDIPDQQDVMKDEHMAMGRVRGGTGNVRVKTRDGDVRITEG